MILLSGAAGTGKAQPLYATVWTPSGPRRMGDIKPGDRVLTPDGGRATVKAVYPQGMQKIYRLTFTGGDSVECTADHLWSLRYIGGKPKREIECVRTVAEILPDYLVSVTKRPKYWIPSAEPVAFYSHDVPVPAYTLGVLLGDGYIRPGRLQFTTADREIADRVAAEVAPQYKLTESIKPGNAATAYAIVGDGWRPRRPMTGKPGYVYRNSAGNWMAVVRVPGAGPGSGKFRYIKSYKGRSAAEDALAAELAANPGYSEAERAGDSIHADLDTLGLRHSRSATKFIPDRYKYNSAEVRLDVLRGLMDTDGTVDLKTGTPSITTVSSRLADDVKDVVESLGGVCRITTKKPKGGQLAYTCWIRVGDPAELFYLQRKIKRTKARTKYPVKRMLLSIEQVGEAVCQCIEVDHPDSLYLTNNFVVTHNSVPCMMKLHLVCLSVPRVRCLVVRKTLTSLVASTLVSFREKVAAEALAAGLLRFYGGSQQEPASYRYANGSVLVMGGCDKATAFLSTEYDLCFADEAIELTAEDVETIDTRLRNGRLSYQQFLMATNPGAPTHHLKAMERDGRLRILYSKHEDNPRLHDGNDWTEQGRTYLERLNNLSGARYHRLRWGRWVASEGMIYGDEWDESVHHVPWFLPPDSWERWWSIDFGFTNPLSLQCYAEDPDGRLWLYREIYFTRRTVDQHCDDILRCVAEPDPNRPHRWIWHERKPRGVICDHDAEGREVFRGRTGLSTRPAKKGVSDGIQAVQARLRPAADGKPRIYIMKDTLVRRDQELVDARLPTCTVEEVPEYVWAKPGASAASQAPKEVPLKQNDHGMDALRYLCAERESGPVRVRILG